MVLKWFGGQADVAELIARRRYDKALEAVQGQIDAGDLDPRLRMQLADILIVSGRDREAVPVLTDLADELARQGEAGKAIALLKKIERIQPGRSAVESRLARLIKEKRPQTGAVYRPREGLAAEGYEPAGAVFSAEHFEPASQALPSDEQRIEAARQARWVAPTHQAEPATEEPFVQLPLEPEPGGEAPGGRVLDAIREVMPDAGPEPDLATASAAAPSAELVETPLFSGFSDEELVAVMRGLQLLNFEPGDIVITEGDPGDSLFILTTGVVKAFVKHPGGTGQRRVRTMTDGAFFGEISILSGKPRTATVTAATRCELLELDRANLDRITQAHPRVLRVLEEFYIERATS